MEKLADISMFEALPIPVVQVAVFNETLLSGVSENIPSYINQAAKEIVGAVLPEYRNPNTTERGALNKLKDNLKANKRDLKDLFYTLLISAIDLRLYELGAEKEEAPSVSNLDDLGDI